MNTARAADSTDFHSKPSLKRISPPSSRSAPAFHDSAAPRLKSAVTGRLGGERYPEATRSSVSSEVQWSTFACTLKAPSSSPFSSRPRNAARPAGSYSSSPSTRSAQVAVPTNGSSTRCDSRVWRARRTSRWSNSAASPRRRSHVSSVDMWSTAKIRSQKLATFRIACSTWRSSLRTRTIPTTCTLSAPPSSSRGAGARRPSTGP